MPVDRIESLKQILEANPANTLARYGLAMEFINSGAFESAVAEFRTLLQDDPSHVYASFHAAQALEKLGRTGEAKQMYERGLEAAVRSGDSHARDKIREALQSLRHESELL
jgi:Tfp pilus assembly protein PilF